MLIAAPAAAASSPTSGGSTAALAAVGLTLAMESDVRDDIEAGRLVSVLDDWTPTLPPLSLYYPSRRNPTAAFKAFIDFARRHGGATSGG